MLTFCLVFLRHLLVALLLRRDPNRSPKVHAFPLKSARWYLGGSLLEVNNNMHANV